MLRRRSGDRLGLRDKTFWDWLDLLIAPLVIAFLIVFIQQQFSRQQEQLEAIRRQSEVAREFIDRIAEDSGPLQDPHSGEHSAAKEVAEARLDLALDELDLEAKMGLVTFLMDLSLVQQGTGCGRTGALQPPDARVISLAGIDLAADPGPNRALEAHEERMQGRSDDTWADLSRECLNGVDFTEADLSGADLGYNLWARTVNLTDARLEKAHLAGTDLTDARLTGADLRGADLSDATLDGVGFLSADLTGADLSGASIRGAILSTSRTIREVNTATTATSGATVVDADFSDVEGMDDQQRQYLCENGAHGISCPQ